MTNAWEGIDSTTDRLRVPEGWLVRVTRTYEGIAVHVVFVRDEDHKWPLPAIREKSL